MGQTHLGQLRATENSFVPSKAWQAQPSFPRFLHWWKAVPELQTDFGAPHLNPL